MNLLLSVAQLTSIIGITLYEYKRKYLSVFLWATLIIMFGIPHFLGIVSNNTDYNEIVMIQASIFVLLFNTVYLISRVVLSKLPKVRLSSKETVYRKIGSDYINNRIKKILLVILLFCVFIIAFLAIKYMGGITNASWGQFMALNRRLGWFSPIKYILFFYFPAASVILSFKEEKQRVYQIITIGAILFYVIVSGNRVTILPLIVAFIIPYIYTKNKKISIRSIIILAIIGLFSIYLIYFLRLLRVFGGFYTLFASLNFSAINQRVLEMLLSGDGELSLRNAFYYFIDNNNNFPGFNRGHTYIRILMVAIPTSLSGGLKPPDFAITMGSAWTSDFSNTVYSMTPTLYGDVFANFWWFGILMGIFWACINKSVDRIVDRENKVIKSVLLVLFGTLFIAIGRGSVYNQFFIGLVSSTIIGVIYMLSKYRLRL
jgi:hypothetical protein